MSNSSRKLVILNQATNYLTVGFANAFYERYDEVVLVTGSVHVQGEELADEINVHYINKWYESPTGKKAWSYLKALLNMWWVLLTSYRSYEVLFISVPPMGYLLNLLLPHRFSVIIWDVYPDIFKITGMSEKHLLYRVWASLNKHSFRKAYSLFTISERMADLLEQYVPREKVQVQPIWSIFQANEKVEKSENPFIREHQLDHFFIIQYSGNIGLTHKVELMVALAEKLQDYDHLLFQIICRGPRKTALKKMVEEKNLPNCQFLPFQSDEMFPYSLSAADLGVVMLDEKTSKGSVPSKSYNLMSYGIPALYIAAKDSELQDYATRYGHARCFRENELDQAAQFILELSQNQDMHDQMSTAAERAAKDFRRENADKLVAKYLSQYTTVSK